MSMSCKFRSSNKLNTQLARLASCFSRLRGNRFKCLSSCALKSEPRQLTIRGSSHLGPRIAVKSRWLSFDHSCRAAVTSRRLWCGQNLHIGPLDKTGKGVRRSESAVLLPGWIFTRGVGLGSREELHMSTIYGSSSTPQRSCDIPTVCAVLTAYMDPG